MRHLIYFWVIVYLAGSCWGGVTHMVNGRPIAIKTTPAVQP